MASDPQTTEDDDEWERYTGDVVLVWKGGDARPEGIDERVMEDIRQGLGGLSCPGNLITHHVKLTTDWEGPSVHVYGVKGDPAFHCSYHAVTEWTSGVVEVESNDDKP